MPWANYEDLLDYFRPTEEEEPDKINAVYLAPAEATIKGLLARAFDVASMDAHPICKTLALEEAIRMMMAYAGDDERAKVAADYVTKTTGDLVAGSMAIITGSGTQLWADSDGVAELASGSSYKPTFDMRDAEDQRVDPDRIDAEWSEDRG